MIVNRLPFTILPPVPGVCEVMFVVTPAIVSAHEYLRVGPPEAEQVKLIVSITRPIKKAAV